MPCTPSGKREHTAQIRKKEQFPIDVYAEKVIFVVYTVKSKLRRLFMKNARTKGTHPCVRLAGRFAGWIIGFIALEHFSSRCRVPAAT